jgi:protein-S-isoprenylcysteine O-methyltransferase Ste14
VRPAGVVVAAAGLLLALRSALLLLGRGRPQRGPRPALIIAGPYTRIRNPLAAGLVLTLVGLAITERSVWMGGAALVVWLAVHAWIVGVEEPSLRTRFGPAYDAYLKNVPRWLPAKRTRGPSVH